MTSVDYEAPEFIASATLPELAKMRSLKRIAFRDALEKAILCRFHVPWQSTLVIKLWIARDGGSKSLGED